MKEQDSVFEVWHPDLDEGRDGHFRVALFSNASAAASVARRKAYCTQGAETHPARVERIPVFSSTDEFDDYSRSVLRRQALAKLTQEEREALGV